MDCEALLDTLILKCQCIRILGSGIVWRGETPGEPQGGYIFGFTARGYARPTNFSLKLYPYRFLYSPGDGKTEE